MKSMKLTALVALLVVGALLLIPETGVNAEDAEAAPEKAAPVEIVLDGTNVALADLLPEGAQMAEGPSAQVNVLRVTGAATMDGEFLGDLEGKVLHYLPTKEAEPILMGDSQRGTQISIEGTYYADGAMLLVKSVTLPEEGWIDVETAEITNKPNL